MGCPREHALAAFCIFFSLGSLNFPTPFNTVKAKLLRKKPKYAKDGQSFCQRDGLSFIKSLAARFLQAMGTPEVGTVVFRRQFGFQNLPMVERGALFTLHKTRVRVTNGE